MGILALPKSAELALIENITGTVSPRISIPLVGLASRSITLWG